MSKNQMSAFKTTTTTPLYILPPTSTTLRTGAIASSARRLTTTPSTSSVSASISDMHATQNIYSTGPTPHTIARTEMDSHADTCCLGPNFIPTHYTNYTCTVAGFTEELDALTDIPIVTGVTAYDDLLNNTTYLIFIHQALYFGTRIATSLINPQQCRSSGIIIQDNPFDRRESLYILDPVSQLSLPMNMNGSFVGLTTRVPSKFELQSCPHRIHLTSDSPWNPKQINGLPESHEEGAMNRLMASVFPTISSVNALKHELDYPVSLTTNQTEFDIAVTSCSSCYHLPTMVERMISSVEVASHLSSDDPLRTDSVIAQKRHTGIDPYDLARKWNVSIKRARETLKSTTQQGSARGIIH